VITETLQGLPPYGNPAKSFPNSDAFSEGLVVRFTPTDGERWVGNFALSWKLPSGVHEQFGEHAILVVAGGDVFVVDAKAQTAVLEFVCAKNIRFEADLDVFLITDDCYVAVLGRSGVKWRSRRIAWDGITDLERRGRSLHGLAFDIGEQPPVPFTIDLETGRVTGGSYIPD